MKSCDVLVVEDNSRARGTLCRLLRAHGHRAIAVANGLEALEYLFDGDLPDVILLDLKMPVMDGRLLAVLLATDPHLARIPVVVLSAYIRQSENLTAYALIQKPYDPLTLVQAIQAAGGNG